MRKLAIAVAVLLICKHGLTAAGAFSLQFGGAPWAIASPYTQHEEVPGEAGLVPSPDIVILLSAGLALVYVARRLTR